MDAVGAMGPLNNMAPRGHSGSPSMTWLSSTRWRHMDAVGAEWTRGLSSSRRRGAAWTRWGPLNDVVVVNEVAPRERSGSRADEGGPSTRWLRSRWRRVAWRGRGGGPSMTWLSSTRWRRVNAVGAERTRGARRDGYRRGGAAVGAPR